MYAPCSAHHKDAGYNHMNIDDCYSERARSPSGDIVASRLLLAYADPMILTRRFTADKQRFPNGMKKLTDEIHALGL